MYRYSANHLLRASSFAARQRAPIAPSLFVPALRRTMATTKTGILEAVADDHQEMYTYYDQYTKNMGNPEAQDRWARQLIWEVARHAVGEELVVYPLMEKHLGAEGKRLADEDRADHQQVKELLHKIESYSAGSEDHALILKTVMDKLRPHNESEENNDLPMLVKAIGADESSKAAMSFQRTKKFVPTRSHPGAPNKPPFETLAGFMAAPLDKLKDAFAQFPSEEEKDAAMKN